MRNFIDMVALTEAPIENQSLLSDAYFMLHDYVTAGEWHSPNEWDDQLDQLMRIIKRPDHGMRLYRILRLTDDQRSQYEAGDLVLFNRRYSSWTKDPNTAHYLAQVRGTNSIMIEHEFSADHIVVDVESFYNEHEFTRSGDYPEYHQYVTVEKEVIVHDSGRITIDQTNSRIVAFEPVVPPVVGDKTYYHGEDDDGTPIIAVGDYQPYADRGIFYIETGDSEYTVRNTGPGEWETVGLGVFD